MGLQKGHKSKMETTLDDNGQSIKLFLRKAAYSWLWKAISAN